MKSKSTNHKNSSEPSGISFRELEILKLLCEGKSTKEISNELNISTRTVETHRQRIMHKTESKNVVNLVIYALSNNIVLLQNIANKAGVTVSARH